MYMSILKREFQLMGSFGSDAFKNDPMWEDLLRRSETYAAKFDHTHTTTPPPSSSMLLDSDMFQSVWNDIIIATAVVLENVQDEGIK